MSDKLRTFLSIDIRDNNLLDNIAKLQNSLDQEAAKMKIVKRENIHFTWKFFGDTSSKKRKQIREKLDGLQFAPFEIVIEGLGVFPNIRRPRIIWVGVTDNINKMRELKKQTENLLAEIGIAKERRKFIPHATIARVRSVYDKTRFQDNIKNNESKMIGTMMIDEICMTKSTLTSSGPIYETLWKIKA